MKKVLMSMALAAALLIPSVASAQTETTADNTVTTCQNAPAKKCHKDGKKMRRGGKKDQRQAQRKGPRGMRPESLAAFAGIELTQAQKEAIAKINTEAQAARRASRKAMKEARAEARKESEKARADFREARMKARLEYLHKFKAVLTPDQYIQFLENTAANVRR